MVENRRVLLGIEERGASVDIVAVRGLFGGRDADYKTAMEVAASMPRRWTGSSTIDRVYGGADQLAELLAGECAPPTAQSAQTGMTLRLTGSKRWHFVLPPPAINAKRAFRSLSSHKQLSLVHIRYDADAGGWSVRHSRAGVSRITVDWGLLSSPPRKRIGKSDGLPARFYSAQVSTLDAMLRVLKMLDLNLRALRLVVSNESIRVEAVDGLPLRPKDLAGGSLDSYVQTLRSEAPLQFRLRRAIEKGDPAATRQALRDGADVDEELPETSSHPIELAVLHFKRARFLEVVRVLLEAGARVGGGPTRDPLLVQVASFGRSSQPQRVACSKLLLQFGADLNEPGNHLEHGGTALHAAVRAQSLDLVQFLLSQGADVDRRNNAGRRPIDCVGHRNMFDENDTPTLLREMLAAAERGERPPPPGRSGGAGSRRMRTDFNEVVKYMAARHALAERLACEPAAATPEQVGWLVALSAPPTLTLDRITATSNRRRAIPDTIRKQLADAGFDEAGMFAIREIPEIKLLGAVSTKLSLYAAVYALPGVPVDIVRMGVDGSAVTVTTSEPTAGTTRSPRNFRRIRLPSGTSVAKMIAVIDGGKRVRRAVAPASVADFVPTFVRVYPAQSDHGRRSAFRAYHEWTKSQPVGE